MANIDLEGAIQRELTLFSKEVTEKLKNEAKSHMDQLVKETKETAPVGNRQKHYRDNISSKKTKEDSFGASYTWYVKGSDFRLSHLLENGHALRDGGRVEGTHFIQKASDPIIADFVEKVEEAIRNG
jgi:hypothetical protein